MSEKEIYELMKKAHQISTMIGKMEIKLEELNKVLEEILNKCFDIIENDAQKPKKLNYVDPS